MRCEECLNEVMEGAQRCGHCGEIQGGKDCPECQAKSKPEARVCRWCGHRFRRDDVELTGAEGEIRAGVLPSVLFRGRFIPQSVEMTQEKLIVRVPGLFHLWTQDNEVPWDKISGFGYRDGVVWDRVTVETRGQEATTIVGLSKEDGARLRTILQDLEH